MKNKRSLKYTAILGIALFMSCSDFLDPYPYGRISEEDLWNNSAAVQGLVNKGYDYMSSSYFDASGVYLDGATDDAVVTSTEDAFYKLAVGTLPISSDPFESTWIKDYRAITSVNLFLKDNKGYNTRFYLVEHYNGLTKNRLQGEAFALRAWFEWDLLKYFGGKGIDSQELLGYPIVTEPLDIESDKINLKRDSYDDCAKQIIADCDSAYNYLPIAHRDFLQPSSDLGYAGGRFWGRLDGITTRAIKADVYLTWASPLFNPGNAVSRWDSAAKCAKEVIDFKLTVDNVTGGFIDTKTPVDWRNPNFPGLIYGTRFSSSSTVPEKALYPAGFQGNAIVGATQELVDAFPMSNGYPKDHPQGAALYDPNNPYANRDPMFYSVIFYNNSTVNRNGTDGEANVMYTFQCWDNSIENVCTAGKDAAGISGNSRTNYHVKKFLYLGWNPTDQTVNTAPFSKFYYEWANMVLTFAEAANELAGPNTPVYGLTAKDAIKYLRQRNTYDKKPRLADSDPYLDEVAAAGKDEFRALVKNERRIQTCFQGQRFFDLRRWSNPSGGDALAELNKPVHKVGVTIKADGTFDYNTTQVVDNRVYHSLYLPIPYAEILMMSNLEQNEGWNSWK